MVCAGLIWGFLATLFSFFLRAIYLRSFGIVAGSAWDLPDCRNVTVNANSLAQQFESTCELPRVTTYDFLS